MSRRLLVYGVSCSLLAMACSYDASFVDCTIQCTADSGCPDGFSCAMDEALCRPTDPAPAERCTPRCAGWTLGPQQKFTVQGSPGSIAVADLDGDKVPDLVVGNGNSTAISVLRGLGGRNFAAAQTYNSGSAPTSVAIVDVDRNGTLDVVATNFGQPGTPGAGDVSVLLGAGDATFGPPTMYPVGNKSYSVAVGDLNGDGAPDLAVSNFADGTASVLLNIGNGTFAPKQDYGVEASPNGITMADVDGDGALDLVVANTGGNSISLLVNRGDGTFGPQGVYPTAANPQVVAVADFDHDGAMDFAVASATVDELDVLYGFGGGRFARQATFPSGSAVAVVAGDLNLDGRLDLIGGDYSAADAITVLLGTGSGSFAAPRLFPAGAGVAEVSIADLDGDGVPDAIVGDSAGLALSVFYGTCAAP